MQIGRPVSCRGAEKQLSSMTRIAAPITDHGSRITTLQFRAMTLDEQLEYLAKGTVDLIEKTDLKAKLQRGKPLTVKVGFGPTAPDIHLGHTVEIRKMKHFQQLGRRVLFLISAFTGMIA